MSAISAIRQLKVEDVEVGEHVRRVGRRRGERVAELQHPTEHGLRRRAIAVRGARGDRGGAREDGARLLAAERAELHHDSTLRVVREEAARVGRADARVELQLVDRRRRVRRGGAAARGRRTIALAGRPEIGSTRNCVMSQRVAGEGCLSAGLPSRRRPNAISSERADAVAHADLGVICAVNAGEAHRSRQRGHAIAVPVTLSCVCAPPAP